MTVVGLPSVVETFQRALHEVIAPFLTTGNPYTLMGIPHLFYKCDIYYSIDRIPKEPTEKPFICFAGTRSEQPRTMKCLDTLQGARSYAYQLRQNIYRTVHVGIGKNVMINLPPYPVPPLLPRMSSQLDVDTIWSHLWSVIAHEHAALNSRGIHIPQMPAVPAQVPHEKYYLLKAEASFEIQFPFSRGN